MTILPISPRKWALTSRLNDHFLLLIGKWSLNEIFPSKINSVSFLENTAIISRRRFFDIKQWSADRRWV